MASTPTNTSTRNRLFQLIEKHEAELLKTWVAEQLAATTMRTDLIKEFQFREQSREFWVHFAMRSRQVTLMTYPAGMDSHTRFLKDLSRRRASQGFSPSETAMFIFRCESHWSLFCRRKARQRVAFA